MRGSLNLRDFLKGLVMAVGVPALLLVQQSMAAGQLTINWKALAMSSIAGLITYLLKNLATDDVKAAHKTLEEARKA